MVLMLADTQEQVLRESSAKVFEKSVQGPVKRDLAEKQIYCKRIPSLLASV